MVFYDVRDEKYLFSTLHIYIKISFLLAPKIREIFEFLKENVSIEEQCLYNCLTCTRMVFPCRGLFSIIYGKTKKKDVFPALE